MSRLIDTHCHLDDEYFPEGADAVIARAHAAGVAGMVVIGVGQGAEAARQAVALARRRPHDIAASVGVHPHDAAGVLTDSGWNAPLRDEIEALATASEVVAVGECGLDFHYDHSPREAQHAVFRWQLELARRLGKPVTIHTRSARDATLEVLAQHGPVEAGGIIHCFSEDLDFATRAIALGYVVSFSGIVTFKSAKAIQEAAAHVPGHGYLVETDSPYLAPIPHRGKPCEPAFVVHTARKIAELRGLGLDEVAAQSTANAERVLGRSFTAA